MTGTYCLVASLRFALRLAALSLVLMTGSVSAKWDEELRRGGWDMIPPTMEEGDMVGQWINRRSIVVEGTTVRAWILQSTMFKPLSFQTASGGTVIHRSKKLEVLIDCRRRTFAIVSFSLHSEEFGNGRALLSHTAPTGRELSSIPPESVAETYSDEACKALSVKRGESDGQANVRSKAYGTGWLSEQGYVITAHHVIAGGGQITASSGGMTSVATVVAADPANDIAVLAVAFEKAPTVGLRVSVGAAPIASRIFTIGFPHPDVMGIAPKYTAGEISSGSGVADDPRLLQISAPVQAGNSGGPVVNTKGEVVGIISSKLSASRMHARTGDLPQNVNYAVKARYVSGLLSELAKRERPIPPPRGRSPEELAKQVEQAVLLIVAE